MKTFNQFIEATLPKTKVKTNKKVEIATHDKPLFKSVPATGVRGDQPEMTEKGKEILPNLPDPTIIKGKKVVHKEKRPRVFGDPTGEMTKDFFK